MMMIQALKRWWWVLLLGFALLIGGFVIWAETPLGPMPEAMAALESDDYWNRYAEDRLPIYTGSWIEDIHDPHNWVVPYTLVNFGSQLNLPADLTRRFKEIIDRGVAEQDPARRAQIYAEFNRLFYEQAPVILMYQSLGRRYQQRWVRGWYSNPILPGLYFYALSKD